MNARQSHTAYGGIYGDPRVHADLVAMGACVNVKTVAKSMHRQSLKGAAYASSDLSPRYEGFQHNIPDRACRKWDRGVLNQVWISDITYLFTSEGWLFLCVIYHACSRRVIG